MSSPLLLLAEVTGHVVETAAAHGEAAPSGLTKITQDFGIQVPFIIAQVVSFSFVAFILWKFAFKPVLATLDERQQKIAAGLAYAEDMKAQLAQAQTTAAAQLKDAQVAASKIIDEARKTAKELSEREAAAAITQAAAIIAKAHQSNVLEYKKTLDEARTEIARLVIATTERVLSKKLSESDRAGYNEAAARELTSV